MELGPEDVSLLEWCPHFIFQEIQHKGSHALHNMLIHETNSLGRLYVLRELMKRNEPFESEDTAEERIEVRRIGYLHCVHTLNPYAPVHLPGVGG